MRPDGRGLGARNSPRPDGRGAAGEGTGSCLGADGEGLRGQDDWLLGDTFQPRAICKQAALLSRKALGL